MDITIEISEHTVEDYEYPSYVLIGWILVRVGPSETGTYRHFYEVLDYDTGTSVFYIQEGTGFDYWLDEYCEFPEPGIYMIEGIVGHYTSPIYGWVEADEDWEYSKIRLATEEEIKEFSNLV